MVSNAALHHIRLFYAAYFAAMGLLLPFFPVYLEQRGLAAGMIGVMTGLLAAAKVVAPPWAGHMLEGRPSLSSRRFVGFSALLACLLAFSLGLTDSMALLALCVFAFGLLYAAILPLTDGLSVAVSEAAIADYGRLRLWGSIGFVIASLAGGIWLMDAHLDMFPLWLSLLLLATAWAARGFPLPPPTPPPAADGSRSFPAALVMLFITGFLMQASHGAYYGFFSLYLADHGYAGWQIGCLWVIGVMAEIILMMHGSRRLQQLKPAPVFIACLLLAALRWLGTGLTTAWPALIMLQLLHAASFAAFHVTAVTWVQRLAPAGRYSAAQGWYSAMGFGLGTTLGVMGCGMLVEAGGYPLAFMVCGGIALAGILPAMKVIRG